MIVFDDVFVPWDRVFICGEHEYATLAAYLFALFHRHSYTGCKPAFTDVVMGFGALIADYNGVYDRPNIRERLVELATTAELVYAAGVASAFYGQKTPAGTFIPNEVYANVGRMHAGKHFYRELEILADLAGGLAATLPFAEDFLSEEVGPYIKKYIKRRQDVPPEHVYRCLYGISNILCSSLGGVMAVRWRPRRWLASHGGDSYLEDLRLREEEGDSQVLGGDKRGASKGLALTRRSNLSIPKLLGVLETVLEDVGPCAPSSREHASLSGGSISNGP